MSLALDEGAAGAAPSAASAASAAAASSSSSSAAAAATPGATVLQDLIAGGVAGSASVVVGHPFDTYKVRLQTSAPGSERAGGGILGGRGGMMGLFRGMGAPLGCAALVNAIIFGSYGEGSRAWDGWEEERRREGQLGGSGSGGDSFAKTFACGSFAGFVQAFVIVPVEHVKCRLQVQQGRRAAVAAAAAGASPSFSPRYRGPIDAGRRIVAGHGIRGLYRGWWVTCWREVPAFGMYFSIYDLVKRRCDLALGVGVGGDGNGGSASAARAWGASALAGGCSGSLTWLMIYPFDIIKSRVQTAPLSAPGEELRMAAVARSIVAQHGIRHMFRGLGVTVFRAFPVNGIIFPVYEFTLGRLVTSGMGGRG